MQLYTKNNELTDYGLSCGYIERKQDNYGQVTLFKEHAVFHVKRISYFVDGRPIQDAWLCFESIKDARRAFKRQCQLHDFKLVDELEEALKERL
jgi:hypothetical protein